ncbi:MAG: TetR/AcrR family transcriptional regulator [Gammaproteobacteria bacterium]|nr:TetR/AcrR family transcriptional regulator [Gammaproteobacteria bacterium]
MDDAAGVVTGLFLQRNCTALTMQEVAEALNLSRSTIYGTWGSKEGLFTAVLDRYGPSRAPGLSEVRAASAPRAALVRLFERATAVTREPCLVINTLVEFAPGDRGPEIGRLVDAAVLDLEKTLGDAVGRGQDAGEIAPGVDPARTGHALLALYLGLYVLMRSGTAGEPVLRAVVRQVEVLLPAPPPARH